MNNFIEKLVKVVPSKRQLAWHELEFYAFIHFGINTFYNREWGDGKEDPKKFNPTQLDTDQWIRSLKSAGIKAVILTCKHHDGFCLWPSKYTEHSVKNSPYKNGKGDIVRELSESCKKYGLKFGVYLSPWDMHDYRYGDSSKYNAYFINQLTELLSEYGEIFSVWFDGACGEGSNGKYQKYDWKRYYKKIRELQPNAVISICGPDVRWCGNEAGDCRESEWNIVPERLSQVELISTKSQKKNDNSFRQRKITRKDQDLGSRTVLQYEDKLIWYPAEVDTSIRPGWFYHEDEDDKVKSFEELITIYYNSVGSNASLLLNIPPDKRGLIHANDAQRLKQIGDYISQTFSECITEKAKIWTYNNNDLNTVNNIKIDNDNYYRSYNTQESIDLFFEFEEPYNINHIVLRENLKMSQRIEEFKILCKIEGKLKEVFSGTIVGSRKICKFHSVYTNFINIKILKSRVTPILKFIGIYTANKDTNKNYN